MNDDKPMLPVASAAHTVVLLLLIAAVALGNLANHGGLAARFPGLDPRLASYGVIVGIEWVLTLVIWDGVRRRGLKLGDLTGGSWARPMHILRDIGLALGFMVLVTPLESVIAGRIDPGAQKTLAGITPVTWLQLAAWIGVSATAGFCEELIFRGFLQRQFAAWSGRRGLAVLAQGVIFGLAHSYYAATMVLVAIHGCLLGVLALWRKSLRPAMLAHGLQDGLGGVLAFFLR